MVKPRLSHILAICVLILATLLNTGCQHQLPPETPLPSSDAPRLIGYLPFRGEELPLDGHIDLYFDAPMDAQSVERAITIAPAMDYGTSWLDPHTVRLTPAVSALQRDTTYTITISNTAKASGARSLEVPVEIEVQTEGYLKVAEFIPLTTYDVPVDTDIIVVFNRPVVPLSADPRAVNIHPLQLDPPLEGSGEWVNTSIYRWQPIELLPAGAAITVTLDPTLRDQTGTVLDQPYTWVLTTELPRVITVEDTITDDQHYDPHTGLDSAFTVTFNQPMDQASTEQAFSMHHSESGGRVRGSFSWNDDDTVLTFTPDALLTPGSIYEIDVKSTARSHSDALLKASPSAQFSTVLYPAVVWTNPHDGEMASPRWGMSVEFSTNMNIETLTEPGRITISPMPPGGFTVELPSWYWGDYVDTITIDADFASHTTYTVTIHEGAEDIYGNPIAEPYTTTFTTTQLDSEFQINMWEQSGVYDAVQPTRISLTTRNVDQVDFSLYRIETDQLRRAFDWEYKPQPEALIREWQHVPQAGTDQISTEAVYMAETRGALAPGIYRLEAGYETYQSWDDNTEQQRARTFLMVMNTQIILKHSDDEALFWVTDLHTGEPLEGLTVTVMGDQTAYDPALRALGRGITGADGLMEFDLSEGYRLPDPGVIYNGPNSWLFAIVDDGEHFGVVDSGWSDGINVWSFDLPGQSYAETEVTYGYTDRPIYRPGQTVYFRGVYREKDDMIYSLLDQSELYVRICTGYDETYFELFDGKIALGELGTFSGEVTLPADAPLGDYYIGYSTRGYIEPSYGPSCPSVPGRSIRFAIEEYRKPEMELTLTPTTPQILSGETAEVTIDAEYYFGEKVGDLSLEWGIWALPYEFDYQGEGRYRFDDASHYWRRSPFYKWYDDLFNKHEYITSGSLATDSNGQAAVAEPLTITGDGSPWRFVIQAEHTIGDERAVASDTDIIVHGSEYYVGTFVRPYIVNEGDSIPVDVIVVDWQSNPIPNQQVTLQMVRQTWISEYIVTDHYSTTGWHSRVEEDNLGEAVTVITDAEGRASIEMPAIEGGSFKVRATTADSAGRTHSSADFIWVTGAENITWRANDKPNPRIDVVADREVYQAGETASILITSPYQGEVTALITVERGAILSHEFVTFSGSAYTYQLPITNEHVPNVFVSVLLLSPAEAGQAVTGFKMGVVELTITPIDQTLTIDVTPTTPDLAPGSTAEFTVSVTDAAGSPVDAEVSLALVDQAIFALAQPNYGPILDQFYSRQGLGIHTAVPLTQYIEDMLIALLPPGPCNNCGGGPGGPPRYQAGGETAPERIEYEDTAYWRADLRTGSDGTETIHVELPDNLTTWQMDAIAITADTRVGQSRTEIVASLPLLIRPQPPRFFTEGDQPTISALVNNTTGENIDAVVTLEAQGLILEGASTQQVSIPAHGRVRVDWPAIVAEGTEWVDLMFRVQGVSESGAEYADAAAPDVGDPAHAGMLPVLRYDGPDEALIVTGTAGLMSGAGSLTEGILLPSGLDTSRGSVTIQIDPSLASAALQGLSWLEHDQTEVNEQVASLVIGNAATLIALHEAQISNPTLEAQLTTQLQIGLARLSVRQNPDGGWGWWHDDTTSLRTTLYVVRALALAREAGIEIDSTTLSQAKSYLLEQPAHPTRPDTATAELNQNAYLLYVLMLTGEHGRLGEIDSLFVERHRMSLYANALMAQTLAMHNPEDARITMLRDDFTSTVIMSATGAHWEESQQESVYWSTDIRTTAILIDTFTRLWPESGVLPGAVRWLMASRTSARWGSAQDTAWALIGLARWIGLRDELNADYQWTVLLNDQRVGYGFADSTTLDAPTTLTLGLDQLEAGRLNMLEINRTSGLGQLYYTTHLTAYPEIAGLGAISRGITITRRFLNAAGNAVTSGALGDVITVQLDITVPDTLHYVMIQDFFPAGAEAINPELLTESIGAPRPQFTRIDTPAPRYHGWGWWWFSQMEMRDEGVIFSAETLPAGSYQLVYEIRLTSLGEFQVIPPQASEFYFPETYGRGAGVVFTVSDEE